MKKQYLLLVCFIFPLLLCGQPNSWINYSQSYYKIKVAKDGIYRIDSATLANAGIPANIDARRFQLFFHGIAQPIYIHGDSVIRGTKGDYIEFYGVHNSGALINDESSDSLLYTGINPAPNSYITAVPNPYYSMYNDTSTYFLTWIAGFNKAIMTNEPVDTNFSSYIPTPYFTAIGVLSGSSEYYAGARYDAGDGETVNDPRFTQAEGWFMS
ncbi:MAG TPA: hypothetical protein VN922_23390, partial [Bacteroidia bacterium]|nr:hypothetical protein [Bacteroidia bacterium]